MRWMPQSLRRLRMKSATSSAMASVLSLASADPVPGGRDPESSDCDLPSGTDFQTQHVRAVVVAGRIEALALGVQPRRIELRVENALFVVERPGEVRAVGREDRASAPADDVHPFDQRLQ